VDKQEITAKSKAWQAIFDKYDIHKHDFKVIIGSPPCQPFSVGGKQKGSQDKRDGFPIFIKAIETIKPEIWLFENVRGLLYKNFNYFEKIVKQLESLNYIVEWKLLNAVNFGVPQNRERLIVVGHRGKYSFPTLKNSRITVGEALGELATQIPPESKFLTASMDKYIAKYEKTSACIKPRDLHLDKPARTLTCRNLSGATGDMQRILLPDGRRRRLLLKEAARLQSFPDWFQFIGTETNCFNQIGNAVPPLFSYHLAESIKNYLLSKDRFSSEEIQRKTQPLQLSLPI
jgi:DNA (cytosine-5)-methyltransferase 1